MKSSKNNFTGSRFGRCKIIVDEPLPRAIESTLREMGAAKELHAALKVAEELLYGHGNKTSAFRFLARLQIRDALRKARTL